MNTHSKRSRTGPFIQDSISATNESRSSSSSFTSPFSLNLEGLSVQTSVSYESLSSVCAAFSYMDDINVCFGGFFATVVSFCASSEVLFSGAIVDSPTGPSASIFTKSLVELDIIIATPSMASDMVFMSSGALCCSGSYMPARASIKENNSLHSASFLFAKTARRYASSAFRRLSMNAALKEVLIQVFRGNSNALTATRSTSRRRL